MGNVTMPADMPEHLRCRKAVCSIFVLPPMSRGGRLLYLHRGGKRDRLWHAAHSSEAGQASVVRRTFLGGLFAFLGSGSARTEAEPSRGFPPVPAWRSSFSQPLEQIADRVSYYSNGRRDFAVLRYGTCVILEEGLADDGAKVFALETLSEILNFHPDMNPSLMDDGNILVRYNRPAANVVLKEVAQAHWEEIESRHLDGLTASEVLITPLGPNKFDDIGKQALLGRAFMFMDAQAREIVEIKRHT